MDEEYFALYRKGDCQPLGAIRKSMVNPLLEDLEKATGKAYWVKSITPEQAKEITDKITNPSGETNEQIFERILNK